MNFNLVDVVALGSAAYGAWRGRKRGLSRELPALAGETVWLVTGCGLYHWTERGLATMANMSGHSFGLVGFAVGWVAAVAIMRRLKGRIHDTTQKKFPDEKTQRIGGSIAGACKVFVFVGVLILIAGHLPGFLGKPFNSGSLVGSCLTRLVTPIQEKTNANDSQEH